MADYRRRNRHEGRAAQTDAPGARDAATCLRMGGDRRKYNLAAPEDLHEFVGESFGLADFAFAYGAKTVNPILVSTIKARQAGF